MSAIQTFISPEASGICSGPSRSSRSCLDMRSPERSHSLGDGVTDFELGSALSALAALDLWRL